MDLSVQFVKDRWRARFGGLERRCAVGRGGVRVDKREGDGATPAGCWPLRRVLYRADRLVLPTGTLPAEPIRETDGWCDDPGDPCYNMAVRRPYSGRHERLWRDDEIYDCLVNLGHNDDPPVAGLGSAIFLHVARPDYAPTDGCIALARADLLAFLKDATPSSRLHVEAPPG